VIPPLRRPRASRDANAMITNLTHTLVYAYGANMPQDAFVRLVLFGGGRQADWEG
jgi:hypothetical protein